MFFSCFLGTTTGAAKQALLGTSSAGALSNPAEHHLAWSATQAYALVAQLESKMQKAAIFAVVLFGCVLAGPPMAAAVDDVKIVFCQRVADHEPISAAETFTADVGWVYCHTTVANAGQTTQIHHDWYFQGAFVTRQTLPVGTSPSWRTFSAKQMSPAWIGSWEVVVLAADGKELARGKFSVVAAAE